MGEVPLVPELSGEINQGKLGRAAADLEAEGKGTLRIEQDWRGGLANLAADRITFKNKAFFFEAAQNCRDCRG